MQCLFARAAYFTSHKFKCFSLKYHSTLRLPFVPEWAAALSSVSVGLSSSGPVCAHREVWVRHTGLLRSLHPAATKRFSIHIPEIKPTVAQWLWNSPVNAARTVRTAVTKYLNCPWFMHTCLTLCPDSSHISFISLSQWIYVCFNLYSWSHWGSMSDH